MRSVGVYKTDVDDKSAAKTIVDIIRRNLPGCEASFDLEDCENVLRVESLTGEISESKIRNILNDHGYEMEKLP